MSWLSPSGSSPFPAGDRAVVEELYADDVEVWHSATNHTTGRATALAILDWLMAPGVSIR